MHPLASFPSPSRSSWHLGFIPIRAYALCIVAGILVCLWLTLRRWRARGGRDDTLWDIAGWAIVFGIIGGRLYHVVTDPELYFEGKPGTSPLDAFKIWDGGLGIWGAIALGGLGAWIGCRRKGVSMRVFADAAAPGIVLAQGIGRWGNWFNNELFGGPTSLPWGLKIHCMDIVTGHAVLGGVADNGASCPPGSDLLPGAFQPTFLYESVWDVALALALIYVGNRWRLGRGNVFALYVMGYTAGRVWIEMLREDHANHILGMRLNVWTCLVVFAFGLIWFLRNGAFRAERETTPYRDGADTDGSGDGDRAAGGDAGPGAADPGDAGDADTAGAVRHDSGG